MLVDATTVAASPLRDRLVARRVAASTGPAAGVERSLARLWGFFRPDAEEGPGALVHPEPFARALRHLADSLLAPAADEAGAAGGPLELSIGPDDGLWPELYPELLGRAPAPALDDPAAVEPPRLLLVLGCGRSGTTWLERLLMAHPLAGGADATESFLFSQGGPLWQELDRADGLGRWLTVESLTASLRSFYDEVLTATVARHRPGAAVMVEKTPKHTLVIPQIRAVYPDAHYLHLLRDGRDVARSASQVPFFECPTPADGAALWDTVVGLVRQGCSGLDHFRELRYEDLVADPEGSTRSVWSWVGLEPTPAADAELRERVGLRVSRHAGTAEPVGAGTWRTLPPEQLAGVYAEAGDRLVGEGYAARADVRRAMAHSAYWRRRLARRRRTRVRR